MHVDEKGLVWELFEDYSIQTVDFSLLSHRGEEEKIHRNIVIEELCKREKYKGVVQLKDHGWMRKDALKYTLVHEDEGYRIEDIMKQEKNGQRQNGSTRLLVTRCLKTILDTIEKLYVNQRLCVTTLCHQDIRIRKDNQTGYLLNVDACSNNCITITAGPPYYSSDEPIACNIGDSYIAVLVIWIQIVNAEAFRVAQHKVFQNKYEQERKPIKILINVLKSKDWPDNYMESSRKKLLDTMLDIEKQGVLNLDHRNVIMKILTMYSSSKNMGSDLDLSDAYPDSDDLKAHLEKIAQEDADVAENSRSVKKVKDQPKDAKIS